MIECDTIKLLSEAHGNEKSSDQRFPRTVRFSDAEWETVEEAAVKLSLPPSTFVRHTALAATEEQAAVQSAALQPGILELIKRTYLSSYIVATLKRDEMIREGRHDELDRVVRAAREAQAFLLGDAPK